jgi:hypothetical protein
VVVFADGHTAPLPVAKETPYFRAGRQQGRRTGKVDKNAN